MKGHNSFSYLWKFEPNTPNGFGEIRFLQLEILQRMYDSLTFLPPSNFTVFLMADISFNIVCKELKIVQIAQLNQLFQLLHLVHIYGQGFYELSLKLMRKNVNNDVNNDSPIWRPISTSSSFFSFIPLKYVYNDLFPILLSSSRLWWSRSSS